MTEYMQVLLNRVYCTAKKDTSYIYTVVILLSL